MNLGAILGMKYNNAMLKISKNMHFSHILLQYKSKKNFFELMCTGTLMAMDLGLIVPSMYPYYRVVQLKWEPILNNMFNINSPFN